MISFSEFYGIIPKNNQILELHVQEGNNQFDINNFTLESEELHYPWHTYAVNVVYSYYDKDNDDAIIHALIDYLGEDKNVKEE